CDVQCPGPSRYGPAADNALILAARKAGNVVFGTSEVGKGGTTRIFGGGAALRVAHALPASTEYPLDPGAVIRRIDYETLGLDTMPVVAYQRAFGHPPSRAHFGSSGAWIDYNGGPGSIETVSYSDVYNRKFAANAFRGRIVVVGASAQSLQDLHPTSTSGAGEMSGPEIQAHAIDTLIRGVPLHSGPGWLDIALIVLLALIAPLPGLRVGALLAAGGWAARRCSARCCSRTSAASRRSRSRTRPARSSRSSTTT